MSKLEHPHSTQKDKNTPNTLSPDRLDSLSEFLSQEKCTEKESIKNNCSFDRTNLNNEFLNGLFLNLKDEFKGKNDLLQSLNDYFCLKSQDFGMNLFSQIMTDRNLRIIVLESNKGDKIEKLFVHLLSSKPVEKDMQTTNQEKEFNDNFKDITKSLEESLGISTGLITRIIEQESLFGTQLINKGKSTGMMQLNSAPFKNMKEQSEKYKDLFLKIPDNIIEKVNPQEAKKILIDIKTEYSNDNINKRNLNDLFGKLHEFARLQTNSKENHILNLICGSITLAFCDEYKSYKHNSKGEKTGLKSISISEVNRISVEFTIKILESHKGYILDKNDKILIGSILKDIKEQLVQKGENQTKEDFLTAREYNGSSTKNSYAMNVLVSRKFNELKGIK